MATTITPQVLKRRAPAFASVRNSVLQGYIDEAVRWTNEAYWGPSHFDDGIFYLACHIGEQMEALANGTAGQTANTIAPGPVQSEALLSWRVAYAVSEGGVFDDALATTSWGRLYLAARARIFSPREL